MKNPFVREKIVYRADPDTAAEVVNLRARNAALRAALDRMEAAWRHAMPGNYLLFHDEPSALAFCRDNPGSRHYALPGLMAYGVPCTVALARKYPTHPLVTP